MTSTPNDESRDHFEQLRLSREKQRAERQKQKIARSVSQTVGGSVPFDTDLILEQLAASQRNSYQDPNT